jgi:hypothetical protein
MRMPIPSNYMLVHTGKRAVAHVALIRPDVLVKSRSQSLDGGLMNGIWQIIDFELRRVAHAECKSTEVTLLGEGQAKASRHELEVIRRPVCGSCC